MFLSLCYTSDNPTRTLSRRHNMKLNFKLDEWQKEVLAAEGNLCICSGRQVGKSQIVAIKVAEYIANNPKKEVLIISITEEQAENMLMKIMLYIDDNYRKMISKGKNKPTKHRLHLINNSSVVTKAVGQYGLSALGLTKNVVVVDECAYLPDLVWQSITPILLTTGGQLWILSTPNAKEGYFYEAYTNPEMGFKTYHVSSEEVAEKRSEPQRTYMLNYLKREKERMTKLQYAQQYLAQFLEELNQLFPDNLIKASQTLEKQNLRINGEYYLGIDIARMGGDEITFEVLELKNNVLYQRENIVLQYQLTTSTIDKTLELESVYGFSKIYIDDGGMGAAVFDQLLKEPMTRSKIVSINNASRALDRDESRKKKLLKEDLYFNLKRLMERGQIKLLTDSNISASLKSIVYESNTDEVKIYGSYSHIAEGLIRAAWCVYDRKLRLFFESQ